MSQINEPPWEARWRNAVRQEDDLVRFVQEVGFLHHQPVSALAGVFPARRSPWA